MGQLGMLAGKAFSVSSGNHVISSSFSASTRSQLSLLGYRSLSVGSTSVSLCEEKPLYTNHDLFVAARCDWSRVWDADWDGRHPPDSETTNWMKGNYPVKQDCGGGDSKKSSSEQNILSLSGDARHSSTNEAGPLTPEEIFVKAAPRQTVRHIFLIRHGQYKLDDKSESELTALGREQSRKTGKRLKSMADG